MELKRDLNIHERELKLTVSVFRAINNRFRQNLLRYIHNHKQSTVMQMYKYFGRSQSYISQQLSILRRAGLVDFTRDKNSVSYFVRYAALEKLMHLTAMINRR
jgi:DNA-binding transcriptional ArsR family regulator